MKCPLCVDEVLDVTFRSGIEVDVCPRCRGVWLDRGELDRLVDIPADELRAPAPAGQSLGELVDDRPGAESETAAPATSSRPAETDEKRPKPKRPDKPRKKKRRKKKDLEDRIEDLFEELFDFFD